LLAALTEGDSVAIEASAAGLPVTPVDVNGVLPLTAAAQFGNLDVVRVLKERGPCSMRLIGNSIAFGAAVARDITEVDLWLDAVIAAASDTTLRIADLLLISDMRWAQTGPTGFVGNVPVRHLGVDGRNERLDEGDRTEATATPRALGGFDGSGTHTIVHAAAEHDNLALLERVRALDARIDDTTRYGNSPLLTAIRVDAMLATAWLAERGARIVTENRSAYLLTAAFDKIPSWNRAGPPGARATGEALLRAVQPAALRDSFIPVDVINDVLE